MKTKISIKKVLAFLAFIMLACILPAFYAGCAEDMLEYEATDMPSRIPYVQCTYSADKTKFDIDDVRLTFSYGHEYSEEKYLAYGVQSIEIYWENGNKQIPIKTISAAEFFDEYPITYNANDKKQYKNSEVLQIPKELFIQEQSYLMFVIRIDTPPTIDHGRSFCIANIYYKVEENIVTLSTKEFKENNGCSNN